MKNTKSSINFSETQKRQTENTGKDIRSNKNASNHPIRDPINHKTSNTLQPQRKEINKMYFKYRGFLIHLETNSYWTSGPSLTRGRTKTLKEATEQIDKWLDN